jgi:hypothetical protein
MSLKTTEANAALLNHVLNNVSWANIGDAAGLPAGTAGSLYASLHTADPGVGGSQTSSEISYTGYARVALARDNTWWTVATSSATNAKAITFGQMTAGAGGTATFLCIGTATSGTGHLLYRCPITSPGAGLTISAGITPNIAIGAATITEA